MLELSQARVEYEQVVVDRFGDGWCDICERKFADQREIERRVGGYPGLRLAIPDAYR